MAVYTRFWCFLHSITQFSRKCIENAPTLETYQMFDISKKYYWVFLGVSQLGTRVHKCSHGLHLRKMLEIAYFTK